MSITDKTRKLLWGGSGKRCAFCRVVLIMEATSNDDESVVGDECHIVSGAPNGPRYDPDFPKDQIDSYPNLILLCRVHHKMVDDQPNHFTADILCNLKSSHESWVRESLDSDGIVWVPQAADSLATEFQEVKETMPELISEMKADFTSEGNEHIREIRLQDKKWTTYSTVPCFAYFFQDHHHLESKIQILENHGFIIDVTTSHIKTYRVTEEFVKLLVAD